MTSNKEAPGSDDFNPKVLKLRTFWEPIVGLAALATIPMLFVEDSFSQSSALLIDAAIWLVFTAQFLTVLFACRDSTERKAWVRESMLDILIILGSFPILPSNLQSLRLLRIGSASRLIHFLRIGRVFALTRLTKAVARKFRLNPAVFSGTTAIVAILIGANVLHIFEPELLPNLGVALWWAVTTVTTVGYGDLVPATNSGRIVAAVLMVVGMAIMAAFSSALTSYLVNEKEEVAFKEFQSKILEEFSLLNARLDKIEAALGETEGNQPGQELK